MTTLYGIKNCDTIKKTRKWLDRHAINYEFYDFTKLGCPPDLAATFLRQFELRSVINTRGTTWRKLNETTKSNLNESIALQLMVENPSIIKRPVIHAGATWIIGYDEKQLALLNNLE